MHRTTPPAPITASGQPTIARIRPLALFLFVLFFVVAFKTALPWLARGGKIEESYPTLLWLALSLLAGSFAHREA